MLGCLFSGAWFFFKDSSTGPGFRVAKASMSATLFEDVDCQS